MPETLYYATLLKKRHRCFPMNYTEFLITPFLQNTSGRLQTDNGIYSGKHDVYTEIQPHITNFKIITFFQFYNESSN